MKKTLGILLLALSACGNHTKDQPVNENKTFTAYLNLKNALTVGDPQKASLSAKELASCLNKNDSIEITAISHATLIGEEQNLEKQRTLFSDLSLDMVSLAKKGKLGTNTIFVDHCPMALDGKGADWLSDKEEIKNPYFGDQMLECGEVKEKIQQ